jgi:hypothetical protein
MEHVMRGLPSAHKQPLTRTQITLLTAAWRGLLKSVFDPYRPECHYMRGPGPKWRKKHGGEPNA